MSAVVVKAMSVPTAATTVCGMSISEGFGRPMFLPSPDNFRLQGATGSGEIKATGRRACHAWRSRIVRNGTSPAMGPVKSRSG